MSSISRRNPFAMPEPRAAPRNPFEPAAPPAASAAPTAAPAAGKAANSSSSSSLADDPFGLAQQRAHSAAAPVTAAAQAPRPLATQPAAVRPASVTSLPIARPNVVSSAMAAPQPPPTALPATHAQTQIQYASRPQQSKPAIQPEAIAPQPPALGIPPQPPKHSSFTPAVRPKDDDDDDLFGDGDGIAKARSGPAQEISLSDAHATEHLEDNFFDDDDGDGLVIEPATPLSPLQPLSAVRGVRFQPRAAATSSSGASKPATMSAAALRQRMRQAAEWEDIRDV